MRNRPVRTAGWWNWLIFYTAGKQDQLRGRRKSRDQPFCHSSKKKYLISNTQTSLGFDKLNLIDEHYIKTATRQTKICCAYISPRAKDWYMRFAGGSFILESSLPFQAWIYHCHLHPLQAANCFRNSRLVVEQDDWMWFKNSRKIANFMNIFVLKPLVIGKFGLFSGM